VIFVPTLAGGSFMMISLVGTPLEKAEMKGTYLSFLIALTCILIPGLIWVLATSQLFGLSSELAAILAS
jgi:hypothetical protein